MKSTHTAWTETDTPLGRLLIARNAQGLSGLWFEAQKYHPGVLSAPRDDDDVLLKDTVAAMKDYFAGRVAALPPMSPTGTAFQEAVWKALLGIPSGETVTYGELAARLGRPEAVRAVAAAVGRNPVSVLIPCHRVVGADGSLTGYAGGLNRKEALLTIEGSLPAKLRASPTETPPGPPAMRGSGKQNNDRHDSDRHDNNQEAPA
ncbi:methylated-DNA--[protein]-cysteine S-methyltransferase [Roseateles chitinivorans]|uniref:methylated-DNA--[protein]-cysteine S-methyltransferase n=1 Tax=Roseateles chitinivorans TaxID=2917965 RepID=UPI003D66401F